MKKGIRIGSALMLFLMGDRVYSEPPFAGTIFMDPDIITDEDPSLFEGVAFLGEGERLVFDRRLNRWVTLNVFLFESRFMTGREVEVRVNKEFDTVATAEALAEKYSRVIARIPIVLMKDVESVTIHDGVNPFGGGNRNLLIHHGQGLLYEADGILEEVFVHEAAHTSLDADHAQSERWRSAQTQDPDFISDHAINFPDQEDIAESVLAFIAVEHRRERVSNDLADTILTTIPNRLQYFRDQNFDLYPIIPLALVPPLGVEVNGGGVFLVWSHDFPGLFSVEKSSELSDWNRLNGLVEFREEERSARMEIGNGLAESIRFFRLAAPAVE